MWGVGCRCAWQLEFEVEESDAQDGLIRLLFYPREQLVWYFGGPRTFLAIIICSLVMGVSSGRALWTEGGESIGRRK